MVGISITVGEERVSFRPGVTILQALLESGGPPSPLFHGIGCMGGVCGACLISFRVPGEAAARTGLACQTLVSDGMSLLFLPNDPTRPARYAVGPAPGREDLSRLYPTTRRCTACGACTMVCPQGLDVMGGVRAAISGEFEKTAEKFTACILCGLCASVCDVSVLPHRVGIWSRRAVAASLPIPDSLLLRAQEIAQGRYALEMDRLVLESA